MEQMRETNIIQQQINENITIQQQTQEYDTTQYTQSNHGETNKNLSNLDLKRLEAYMEYKKNEINKLEIKNTGIEEASADVKQSSTILQETLPHYNNALKAFQETLEYKMKRKLELTENIEEEQKRYESIVSFCTKRLTELRKKFKDLESLYECDESYQQLQNLKKISLRLHVERLMLKQKIDDNVRMLKMRKSIQDSIVNIEVVKFVKVLKEMEDCKNMSEELSNLQIKEAELLKHLSELEIQSGENENTNKQMDISVIKSDFLLKPSVIQNLESISINTQKSLFASDLLKQRHTFNIEKVLKSCKERESRWAQNSKIFNPPSIVQNKTIPVSKRLASLSPPNKSFKKNLNINQLSRHLLMNNVQPYGGEQNKKLHEQIASQTASQASLCDKENSQISQSTSRTELSQSPSYTSCSQESIISVTPASQNVTKGKTKASQSGSSKGAIPKMRRSNSLTPSTTSRRKSSKNKASSQHQKNTPQNEKINSYIRDGSFFINEQMKPMWSPLHGATHNRQHMMNPFQDSFLGGMADSSTNNGFAFCSSPSFFGSPSGNGQGVAGIGNQEIATPLFGPSNTVERTQNDENVISGPSFSTNRFFF